MAGIDVLFVNPYINAAGDHLLDEAVLWIASFLSRRGLRVRIVDLNRGPLEENREKLREKLRTHRPSFAAISGRWWDSLYGSCDVASVIKEFDPSVVTVTGGETASHFAFDLCGRPEFDVVIRGKSELPLLHLVRGQPLMNCVWKEGGAIRESPVQYFHTPAELEEIRLSPLAEIFDDPDQELGAAPYVWLGDGCPYNCLFCTNAVSAQQSSPNGPGKVRYRPAEAILHDLAQLGEYRDLFLFDFQPIQTEVLDQVIRNVPRKRYGLIYEPWAIRGMDTSLVDRLAETFAVCKFVFDPQVFSEGLRRDLAARRCVKPFVSNEHLESLLERICRAGNALFTISGLCALPFEEPIHVQEGEAYRRGLLERFPAMEGSYVLPLMIEPGSPIQQHPETFSAITLRRTFEEYLAHSRTRIFPSPVPWWMNMLGIARDGARSPTPAHVEEFNQHCGVRCGEDPGRPLRHAAATLANPANQFHLARQPFRPGEITCRMENGTACYWIEGNGRGLLNLAIVARQILESGQQDVELDLTDCAWLTSLPRTALVPQTVYSFGYLHHDPTLSRFLQAAERGEIRARFRAGRIPPTSFLKQGRGLQVDAACD